MPYDTFSRARPALALAVTLLFVVPLVLAWLPAAGASSGTSPPLEWSKFAASLAVAAAAAALAVVIGSCLALLLSAARLPGSSFWTTCCLIPFLAPPTVWALAQVYTFGSGGMLETWLGDAWRPLLTRIDRGGYLATVLVLGQTYAPLALFILGRTGGRLHRAGLESAVMSLRRIRFAVWLLLAVRRELASAFLLAFALSLGNFATPHVLQCQLYAIEIYMRASNYLDPQGAMLAALPLLLAALAAAFLFAWAEPATSESVAGAGHRADIDFGWWRYLLRFCLLAWIGLTIGLPIAGMIYSCGSPGQFLAAAADAMPEAESTLLIGAGASLLACVAAGLIVGGLSRHGSRLLEAAAMIPIGVPALVIALAYASFYNRTWPLDFRAIGNTSLLVILGLAFRSWPFATRVLRHGVLRTPADCLAAARLPHVSFARRLWRIQLPLLAESIAGAALLAFVLAIGDVEISQMLCAPGYGTLSLRLFTFLHFGPTHVAASLALLQLLLACVPVLLYLLVFDRRPEVI